MPRPSTELSTLAATLIDMTPSRVVEVSVPVMKVSHRLLLGCAECAFHNTNACKTIRCWGRFSDVMFQIA